MRKIKVFNEVNDAVLEKRVNEWLAQHQNAIIHHVLQTQSESWDENHGNWSLTVTILYYEGDQSK